MAKKWYPVIDILSCVECGTCVNFCTHGVYDKKKSPVPVVTYPDGCIDHCHGCGNKSLQGAISYAGDDTGWTPPVLKGEESAAVMEILKQIRSGNCKSNICIST